ncbi:MAG: DNA-binding response regulator [Planctomycetia bacterium TMED53]|nr:MAG: DNA-binding response regulator [Planctomycetia bacterium TMED53]
MSKKANIIIVEDEADILDVIEYNLSREGYNVRGYRDGERGLEAIREDHPHLVLLDLMLPGIDGLEICKKVKEDPVTRDIPVIMITAKTEESDVVLGLGVGADDYVSKPFSPKELVARVKAVLRRAPLKETVESKDRISVDGFVLDNIRHDLSIDGESIPMTATEFRMLHFLASHPGRVFSREQLLSKVVGSDTVVIDRNVDVHIRSIRKKLGETHRNLIETVRGVGYRFKY